MLFTLRNQFIWRVALVFCLTIIGQAQTKCPNEENKEEKNKVAVTEKTETPDKSKSNKECDFSSFDPLKQMSGGITELPKPDYPKEAEAEKITGLVSLRVLVDRLGQIAKVCKLKGDDILAESAIEAARKIKVDPAYVEQRLEGKKQNYLEFIVTYNFSK